MVVVGFSVVFWILLLLLFPFWLIGDWKEERLLGISFSVGLGLGEKMSDVSVPRGHRVAVCLLKRP